MEAITFETLPQAVTSLLNEVAELKNLLLVKQPNSQQETEELLTVEDTAKFLSLSVPTIYGLIHKGELPVMKRSKRCYFLKTDLISYLKAGRQKTAAELSVEADAYLNSKK